MNPIDVHERVHAELKKCGVRLAASLPDDWVAPLIRRLDADPEIRHVPVGRESEAVSRKPEPVFGRLPDEIASVLAVKPSLRSDKQRQALSAYFRARAPELQAARDRQPFGRRIVSAASMQPACELRRRHRARIRASILQRSSRCFRRRRASTAI